MRFDGRRASNWFTEHRAEVPGLSTRGRASRGPSHSGSCRHVLPSLQQANLNWGKAYGGC